ncbi:tetratricopeptide repeat protein [Cystobacter fuscus]
MPRMGTRCWAGAAAPVARRERRRARPVAPPAEGGSPARRGAGPPARLDATAGDEKALEALRKLAARKDADAFVLLSLGQTLLTRGRFEDAAEAFERALRLQPEESSLLLSLGMARQGQGRGAGAAALPEGHGGQPG